MLTAARVAVLSELGIVTWRGRAGQAFPGAGVLIHPEMADEICRVDKRSASTELLGGCAKREAGASPLIYPTTDLVVLADTHSEAEAEQLTRIIQAVHGLRAGLRIEQFGLDASPASAHALVRLDDVNFPSPATMLAQPSSKRPLWQALQDIVARLP